MPKLSRELTVMQVKQGYSEVYMYKPTLVVTPKHLKNKKAFIGFIKQNTYNWKDGKYFFRSDEGTFAYFDLREGKISLRRVSSAGKRDLVWSRINKK